MAVCLSADTYKLDQHVIQDNLVSSLSLVVKIVKNILHFIIK